MFTGIIQHVGRIGSLTRNAFGAKLVVDATGWQPSSNYCFAPGDSIGVSGVCLTISRISGAALEFDVIAQTLSMTKLGDRQVGDSVNLEHALTPAMPLGGHVVQGHVDGVGRVQAVVLSDRQCRITIQPPAELLDYIVPKGSIAIDGVSLTVAKADSHAFDVALIPTTLKMTTLGLLTVGAKVNLETDILNRTVVHWLKRQSTGVSETKINMNLLREAGFF